MKTLKPANTHVRTYQLTNSDINRVTMPWYAQILGAAFDAPCNAVVITAAWSPDSTQRETREFLTVNMDSVRKVPAGVLTHIGTVTVPGHAPVVVFEVGSPEEKRARSIADAASGSIRVNNHVGNVGPGGSLVQADVIHGGIGHGGIHAPMRVR